MNPTLNIAIRAARKAGDTISRAVDRTDRLKITVKDQNDFVSEIDKKAELQIIDVIKRAYPDHAILAEESGNHSGDDYLWIIDPLDGTTNFIHGFPQFAVSIALQYKGRLEVAVIYDPMRQELFTATRGGGAQMNDRRIRVSGHRSLSGSLLGTGFPYKDFSRLDRYLGMLKSFVTQTSGVRRPGSAALDLAYVAAGRLDGFWEMGLKPWDIAAGVLIVQEAGGLITDLHGGHDFMETGDIVAGNSKMIKGMLQTIHPHMK